MDDPTRLLTTRLRLTICHPAIGSALTLLLVYAFVVVVRSTLLPQIQP